MCCELVFCCAGEIGDCWVLEECLEVFFMCVSRYPTSALNQCAGSCWHTWKEIHGFDHDGDLQVFSQGTVGRKNGLWFQALFFIVLLCYLFQHCFVAGFLAFVVCRLAVSVFWYCDRGGQRKIW